MDEFYCKCRLEDRPRIFGMSASPFITKDGVFDSVQQLERTLDSKAFSIYRKDDKDLRNAVLAPEEKILLYDPPMTFDPFAPQPPPKAANSSALFSLVECQMEQISKSWKSYIGKIRHTEETLGSWCADLLLRMEFVHLQEKLDKHDRNVVTKDEYDDDSGLLGKGDPIVVASVRQLLPFAEILAPIPYSVDGLTDKARKLLHVLKKMASTQEEQFRCIVFVERRLTAQALIELVRVADGVRDCIRPAVLVGHGGSVTKVDVMMGSKKQNAVIHDLRVGRCNLLFATQVAEEGRVISLFLSGASSLFQGLISSLARWSFASISSPP